MFLAEPTETAGRVPFFGIPHNGRLNYHEWFDAASTLKEHRMTSTVFQIGVALEKLDGELEVLVELADSYLRGQQNYVSAIEQGVSNGDLSAVEDAAHVLKGTLGYFGCDGLVHEVSVLEQLAATGNPVIVKSAYSLMHGKLSQLRSELQQFVVSQVNGRAGLSTSASPNGQG
jgi:HPt (histidine-containing phosphotransfer) domain-containing protein